jgi:hypothetical protein
MQGFATDSEALDTADSGAEADADEDDDAQEEENGEEGGINGEESLAAADDAELKVCAVLCLVRVLPPHKPYCTIASRHRHPKSVSLVSLAFAAIGCLHLVARHRILAHALHLVASHRFR